MLLGIVTAIAVVQSIRAGMRKADLDDMDRLREALRVERAAGEATALELGRALKWCAHLEAALTRDRRAHLRAQYEDAEMLRRIERGCSRG